MALKIEDRVRETTTTTGTGTVNLGGAVTNFETFVANLSNADTTYYAIVDNTNNDFEVGLGTFATGSPNTLARTTPIASSNSNSLVNFGSGTKDVFITLPATKVVYKDASGNVSVGSGSFTANGGLVADNITIDGTEIDLSSGDLTLDVAGDIILDAAGNNVAIHSAGTAILDIANNSSDVEVTVSTADKNFLIKGTDGSSGITALDIDMAEAGAATFNSTVSATGFSAGDGNITNVGDIAIDSISADGTDINIAVSDNSATALTIKQGSDAYLTIDTADSSESVAIGTGVSGTAISIGHSTSETTINDNLTVTGDMTVNGTTTTVNSTTTTVDDPIFTLGGDTAPGSDDNKDRGIEFRWHNGSAAKIGFFGYDDSATAFTVIPDATNSSEVFSGTVGNAVFGETTVSKLIMPDVTSGKILVGDGTSYEEVAVSGDVGLASNGAATIQADAVEASMLNDNVISSQTELASGLASTDELLVSDAGTIKRMDMSVVTTFMTSEGFSKDDPTALAIALG